MKKKIAIVGTLGMALLLGACSGVSEADYNALEKRVSALEKQEGVSNATEQEKVEVSESEDTSVTEGVETSQEGEAKVINTDSKMVTEDGYTLTLKDIGILEDNGGVLEELSDDLSYVYVVYDWEATSQTTTQAWDIYSLILGNTSLTIKGELVMGTKYDKLADKIGLQNAGIESNATPGQKGVDFKIYKLTKENINNINDFELFVKAEEIGKNSLKIGSFKK